MDCTNEGQTHPQTVHPTPVMMMGNGVHRCAAHILKYSKTQTFFLQYNCIKAEINITKFKN